MERAKLHERRDLGGKEGKGLLSSGIRNRIYYRTSPTGKEKIGEIPFDRYISAERGRGALMSWLRKFPGRDHGEGSKSEMLRNRVARSHSTPAK